MKVNKRQFACNARSRRRSRPPVPGRDLKVKKRQFACDDRYSRRALDRPYIVRISSQRSLNFPVNVPR
ncbi:MAG: hypothetical protein MJA29_08720 [Candidatus Omnitrophica bacterium]|nr:hypothetical protein [Candidatus Omnitrophota bacterium]